MRKHWAFTTLLAFLLISLSPYAFAGQIKMAWDPPTTNSDGSPLTNLAGYRIYYGAAPGVFEQPINVPLADVVMDNGVATYTLPDLVGGQTYYIAITAYDASAPELNESDFSNEVLGGIFLVAAFPPGLEVVVDSVPYTAPQTFGWEVGSSHSLSVASPQAGPVEGTRYVYSSWDDGGAQSHTITALSENPFYIAIFSGQYSLTTSVNPAGAGMISPSGMNWYDDGQSVTLSATANAGYTFSGWNGDASGGIGPIGITMDANKTVIGNFTAVPGTGPPPAPVNGLYTVVTSPSGLQITVDGTDYTAPHIFNWLPGSTHTVSVPSPQSGPSGGTPYVFSSWSDGGPQDHTVTAASTSMTYTANFTSQGGSPGPNPANLVVEPDSLDFGVEERGKMVELKVKISNTGSTALNVKSLEISGTDQREFLVSTDCAAITAGGSCNSVIGFAPISSGVKDGTLIIHSDDQGLPTSSVALSAVASDAASASIFVSPDEIHIPYIDIEMGDARTIRINNSGTGSLIINSVTVAGSDASEFSVNSSCTVIAPNSHCDFSLLGRYTCQKAKQVSIVIASNAVNSPKLEIPVTGSPGQYAGGNGNMTLSTTSRTVSREAQNGTVNVNWTGGGGYAFYAVSRSSWITVSYYDNSSVRYSVTANATGFERRGSISIGDQPFTVIQAAGPSDTIFDDVPDNVFDDYINAIYAGGITRGCGQQGSVISYCPSDFVTRGQMAAFISRAIYGETFIYRQTPYFVDVSPSHTFFDYVQRIKDMGITVVSDVYLVDDYVTRGQMAAFIIRAIYGETFNYIQTPYFVDVPDTHNFFKYVQKMKDTGITVVNGIYRVDDYVSREEMAAFLARAFLGMR